MRPPLVLLVDRDADTRVILRAYLEHRGYRVLDSGEGAAALALAARHQPDVVIGDFPLDAPGRLSFSDAAHPAAEAGPGPPVLVFTARAWPEQVDAARSLGQAVITKPTVPRVVLDAVERLLEARHALAGHREP